jgi:uncharacterized protein
MSTPETPRYGSIIWTDLTIPDAEAIREFYANVVGWTFTPVSMGKYTDFQMNAPATGEAVAGICHARGMNAGLPPQWLVYISVEDIEGCVKRCKEMGGSIVVSPRPMGPNGSFCVIKDPAGAVAALFCPAKPQPNETP